MNFLTDDNNVSWLKKPSTMDALSVGGIRRSIHMAHNRVIARNKNNPHNSLMGANSSIAISQGDVSTLQTYGPSILPRRKSILPLELKKKLEENRRKSRAAVQPSSTVTSATKSSQKLEKAERGLGGLDVEDTTTFGGGLRRRETFVRPRGSYAVLQPRTNSQVNVKVYMSTPRSILKSRNTTNKPKIDFRPGVVKQVNFDNVDEFKDNKNFFSSQLVPPATTTGAAAHSNDRGIMRETLDDGALPLLESTMITAATTCVDVGTNTMPILSLQPPPTPPPLSMSAILQSNDAFQEYKENMERDIKRVMDLLHQANELMKKVNEHHEVFLTATNSHQEAVLKDEDEEMRALPRDVITKSVIAVKQEKKEEQRQEQHFTIVQNKRRKIDPVTVVELIPTRKSNRISLQLNRQCKQDGKLKGVANSSVVIKKRGRKN